MSHFKVGDIVTIKSALTAPNPPIFKVIRANDYESTVKLSHAGHEYITSDMYLAMVESYQTEVGKELLKEIVL